MWRFLDWLVMSETELGFYLIGTFIVGFVIGLYVGKVRKVSAHQ